MIRIVVRKDSIEVFGHALFDEKGRDIVCAAVSSLTLGSAKIWEGRSDVIYSSHRNGEASFKFLWNDRNQDLKVQFEFLKAHYQIISKHYLNFVNYCEI